MDIKVTNKPNVRFEALLSDGLTQYNQTYSKGVAEHLCVYKSNDSGELIGGLTGMTYGNWLHVDILWVDIAERGKGVGASVLLAAEQEALRLGCTGSTLDTYSFQALGFYLKQGYREFGMLEGYAGQYDRYYLQKSLG